MVYYNKSGFNFLLYNRGYYFKFLTMGIKNIQLDIFSEEAYLFDLKKVLIGQGVEGKFNFTLYYGYINLLVTNGISYGYEIMSDRYPAVNFYCYIDLFF